MATLGGISRPVRYVAVGAYAAFVLLASVVDPGTADLGARGPLGAVGADAWLHALTYAVLAASIAWAGSPDVVPLGLVVAAAVAFGGAVEVIQGPLAHRTFERGDLAANAVGAVLGATAWRLLARLDPLGGARGGAG